MKTKINKGFTLIELLLVIALMAISVGITSDILVSLIRSYNKSKAITEIEQSANFFGQKLVKELRNAEEITALDGDTNLVIGDTGKSVTFISKDAAKVITYSVEDTGIVTRKVDSDPAAPLTSSSTIGGVYVTCDALYSCFKLLEDSPQVIKISITMQSPQTVTSKAFTGEIKIDDTVTIRETY